jgi:hypothetical protein
VLHVRPLRVQLVNLNLCIGLTARKPDASRSFFSAASAHMPVDDNSVMPLRTPAGKIAFLHVNYTEWKSTSSSKIYGRTGKVYCSSRKLWNGSNRRWSHASGNRSAGKPGSGNIQSWNSREFEFSGFVEAIGPTVYQRPNCVKLSCCVSLSRFCEVPAHDHSS